MERGESSRSLLPGGRSLSGAGGDRVEAETTGSEAHMTTGTVVPGAPPSVVVAADLLCLGLRVAFRASRSSPSFLG